MLDGRLRRAKKIRNKKFKEIMKSIIAISGKSGSGNTSVSTMVANKMNYILVNYTFRQLADKNGITFEEMLEKAINDSSFDKQLDQEQIKLASTGNCVLGSRLAIWLMKNKAYTVYLNAKKETRIRNILKREKTSYEDIEEFTLKRDRNDHERYLKLYGINNDDYEFADLIIETDDLSIEEIAEKIITNFKRIEENKIK